MRKLTFIPFLTLLLLVISATAGPFTKDEFQRRRTELVRRLGPNLIVMMGAPAPEAYRRFRQHNDFYYLTGVEAEGAYLIIDGKDGKTYLFANQGAAPDAGVNELLPVRSYVETLKKLAPGHEKVFVTRARQEQNAQAQDGFRSANRPFPGDSRPTREQAFEAGLKEALPDAIIEDMRRELADMRLIKSAQEIEVMREAARVSSLGCAAAIKGCKPGKYEYELEAECEYAFMKNRAVSAWTSIVASGPNINVLHWMENSRKMEAGDYVLIDAGCDKDYYCADVTRTWPVAGRGSDEFRRVYNATLEAHKAMCAAVKPGQTINGITKIMKDVLKKHGLDTVSAGTAGHYVGMSPHDVGDRSKPFEPGVMFNVEPFIMLPDQNIHVRFEDSCLVTKDGCEILSKTKDLPWELDELIAIRDGKK